MFEDGMPILGIPPPPVPPIFGCHHSLVSSCLLPSFLMKVFFYLT